MQTKYVVVIAVTVLIITACGGGSSSSGGGSTTAANDDRLVNLTAVDYQALAMIPGGMDGKWLENTSVIERRNQANTSAFCPSTTVLGNAGKGESPAWIAGEMVHEDHHLGEGCICSTEAEARALRHQLRFIEETGVGREFVSYLKNERERSLIGVHTCP